MPGPTRIDFERLKRELLARAEQLVPQWLRGGRRDGREWRCGDLTGEPGDSCAVNLHTGAWGDFATGEKGLDLISLYAAIYGLEQIDAAKQLQADYGLREVAGAATSPAPKAKAARDPARWQPITPVPDDAPDYRAQWAHYSRGVPGRHWEYRDADGRLLGVVCRFETSTGGKEILPLSYCAAGAMRHWRYNAFREPRPLYGLPRLKQGKPGRTVIIVEGEKCADALAQVLGDEFAVLTWPGGSKAVGKADWAVLRGRTVICWPDADRKKSKEGDPLPLAKQPGVAAMERIAATLLELECQVTLVAVEDLGELPDGWDCADAIEDGWTADRLREVLTKRLREPGRHSASAEQGAMPDEDSSWLVIRRGEIVPCVSNVHGILARSAKWEGVIAFDEFASRTVKLKPPPYEFGAVGEWDSIDDSRAAMWLSRHRSFTPATSTVAEAIEVLARERSFHPVRAWLQSLKWDGTSRVNDWMPDWLGAPNSAYVRMVARFFLMGMVKRVMQPGCKFDYCLVLEGRQGQFKSTALRVLGGPWFKDTDLNLESKDSMAALQGAWLYELQEMDSLNRAESSKQKSFLSRQVDEFRPVYSRRELKLPRMLVFAGTTNQWEWNKDPTGGRRFWPIEVGDVDLEALKANRDQLFAEAYELVMAGERYFPTPDEQREYFDPEQLKRQASESLVDALHDWVFGAVSDFSLAQAVTEGLKLDASKLTRDMQTRVGIALKALGCSRVEKRNGMTRFWYRPPEKKAASSETSQPAQPAGGEAGDVPI